MPATGDFTPKPPKECQTCEFSIILGKDADVYQGVSAESGYEVWVRMLSNLHEQLFPFTPPYSSVDPFLTNR